MKFDASKFVQQGTNTFLNVSSNCSEIQQLSPIPALIFLELYTSTTFTWSKGSTPEMILNIKCDNTCVNQTDLPGKYIISNRLLNVTLCRSPRPLETRHIYSPIIFKGVTELYGFSEDDDKDS